MTLYWYARQQGRLSALYAVQKLYVLCVGVVPQAIKRALAVAGDDALGA